MILTPLFAGELENCDSGRKGQNVWICLFEMIFKLFFFYDLFIANADEPSILGRGWAESSLLI